MITRCRACEAGSAGMSQNAVSEFLKILSQARERTTSFHMKVSATFTLFVELISLIYCPSPGVETLNASNAAGMYVIPCNRTLNQIVASSHLPCLCLCFGFFELEQVSEVFLHELTESR
jgi:hypothetical protein